MSSFISGLLALASSPTLSYVESEVLILANRGLDLPMLKVQGVAKPFSAEKAIGCCADSDAKAAKANRDAIRTECLNRIQSSVNRLYANGVQPDGALLTKLVAEHVAADKKDVQNIVLDITAKASAKAARIESATVAKAA
jgi:hypothetical protein